MAGPEHGWRRRVTVFPGCWGAKGSGLGEGGGAGACVGESAGGHLLNNVKAMAAGSKLGVGGRFFAREMVLGAPNDLKQAARASVHRLRSGRRWPKASASARVPPLDKPTCRSSPRCG